MHIWATFPRKECIFIYLFYCLEDGDFFFSRNHSAFSADGSSLIQHTTIKPLVVPGTMESSFNLTMFPGTEAPQLLHIYAEWPPIQQLLSFALLSYVAYNTLVICCQSVVDDMQISLFIWTLWTAVRVQTPVHHHVRIQSLPP